MQSFLESALLPVLQTVFGPLHAGLDRLPPWTWRLGVILYILAGALWVLFLKRDSVFAGSPSNSRARDLRLWVPVVLLPYILIYLFL